VQQVQTHNLKTPKGKKEIKKANYTTSHVVVISYQTSYCSWHYY